MERERRGRKLDIENFLNGAMHKVQRCNCSYIAEFIVINILGKCFPFSN